MGGWSESVLGEKGEKWREMGDERGGSEFTTDLCIYWLENYMDVVSNVGLLLT